MSEKFGYNLHVYNLRVYKLYFLQIESVVKERISDDSVITEQIK